MYSTAVGLVNRDRPRGYCLRFRLFAALASLRRDLARSLAFALARRSDVVWRRGRSSAQAEPGRISSADHEGSTGGLSRKPSSYSTNSSEPEIIRSTASA